MDSLDDDEVLFVGTAEAEHTEMYLKAIWHIKEKGDDVKISTIAKRLNVRQPSVVQMLKKLSQRELVKYNKAGVSLTESGEKIAASMIRNSRLLEVLMASALKIDIDGVLLTRRHGKRNETEEPKRNETENNGNETKRNRKEHRKWKTTEIFRKRNETKRLRQEPV